jgi:hypothetical protein
MQTDVTDAYNVINDVTCKNADHRQAKTSKSSLFLDLATTAPAILTARPRQLWRTCRLDLDSSGDLVSLTLTAPAILSVRP